MLQLSESGQNLVITWPWWLGVLMVALGIALAVHVCRHFEWHGRMAGLVAATALLVGGGIHFLTYRITLTPEEGRAYALVGGRQRLDWSQATSITMEERRGRGTSMWLVVHSAAGRRFEFTVTGLSGPEEHRVREYIAARIGK